MGIMKFTILQFYNIYPGRVKTIIIEPILLNPPTPTKKELNKIKSGIIDHVVIEKKMLTDGARQTTNEDGRNTCTIAIRVS